MDIEKATGIMVGERVGEGVGSTTGGTVGIVLGGVDGADVSGAIVGESLGTRGQNSLSGGPRSDCVTTESQEYNKTYNKHGNGILTNLVQPALCPSKRTG
jgi:hypothetical protein